MAEQLQQRGSGDGRQGDRHAVQQPPDVTVHGGRCGASIGGVGGARPRCREHNGAVFSFLYFFKIKISKIYVRFEIFQKYPRSPPIGRQALSVIFFLQIHNEVPGKKRPCRPPNGRQGPVAHPWGDRVPSLFINPGRHMPPFPLSFEPKNSGKKLECLPCCYIFLKWWKSTIIGSRMSGQRMRHLGNP